MGASFLKAARWDVVFGFDQRNFVAAFHHAGEVLLMKTIAFCDMLDDKDAAVCPYRFSMRTPVESHWYFCKV